MQTSGQIESNISRSDRCNAAGAARNIIFEFQKPGRLPPKRILPIIVLSQFAGTSLWFAGNAVLTDLWRELYLDEYAISMITSAIMLGFITGTLVFAFFSLADRFSPVKLFFLSSISGALSNLMVAWVANDASSLFVFRFITGFFLAGIYPVGMKIAADWYEKGLGKALGLLIGALVLGTAFPHLLNSPKLDLPWRSIIYCTSAFAVAGGLLMVLLVGDGPFRKRSGKFQWNAIPVIFSSMNWKRAAFGYFGHMWELYSFWGFIPVILTLYGSRTGVWVDIPLFSFLIIGAGGIGSVIGGYVSQKTGSAKVAFFALLISCCCCFLSPLFYMLPPFLFITALFVWGLAVVPDSPQLSTLVAQFSPGELRGTALTIYNSIGFAITVISLQLIDRIFRSNGFFSQENTFLLLGIGPLLGLIAIFKLRK